MTSSSNVSIVYDTTDDLSSSEMSLVESSPSSAMSLVDSPPSRMSLTDVPQNQQNTTNLMIEVYDNDCDDSSLRQQSYSPSSRAWQEGILNSFLRDGNFCLVLKRIEFFTVRFYFVKNETITKDLPVSNKKEESSTIDSGDKQVFLANTIPEQDIHGNRQIKRTKGTKLTAQKKPVNVIRVIHNILNLTIDEFIDGLENDFFKNKIVHLKKQIEKEFQEKYVLFEKRLKLQKLLDQIGSKINKTEKELLEAKENHHDVCMEMHKERTTFKNEEEERKKYEELHTFLSNIEIFRKYFILENITNMEVNADIEMSKLVGTTTNIISCSGITSSEQGYLSKLTRFNELLEKYQETLEQRN